MLCYIILYYIVLYCIILYYIILCYVILYYTILYYIVLYCIILYYINVMLCYIILYYIILYYIMLCYIPSVVRVDGWMHGWMDAWMDGWMDGYLAWLDTQKHTDRLISLDIGQNYWLILQKLTRYHCLLLYWYFLIYNFGPNIMDHWRSAAFFGSRACIDRWLTTGTAISLQCPWGDQVAGRWSYDDHLWVVYVDCGPFRIFGHFWEHVFGYQTL